MPDAASFASGLIIGSDVAARSLTRPIDILADPKLGELYKTAIETLGGTARIIDSHAAFVGGISAMWSRI